jgi:predicted RNA binding protein YcfA (HicA-like mRNA interferase family)
MKLKMDNVKWEIKGFVLMRQKGSHKRFKHPDGI